MFTSAFRLCLLCVFIPLFSACATTGDPGVGGLLGWSEKKAQQRQQNLEGQAQQAQQANIEQQRQTAQKRNEKQVLTKRVERSNQDFARLIDENRLLSVQLDELVSSRSDSDKKIESLKQQLQEIETPDQLAKGFTEAETELQRNSYFERLKAANEFYTDSIIFLLNN